MHVKQLSAMLMGFFSLHAPLLSEIAKAAPHMAVEQRDSMEADRLHMRGAIRGQSAEYSAGEDFMADVNRLSARLTEMERKLQLARQTERTRYIRLSIEERQRFRAEIESLQAEFERLEERSQNQGSRQKTSWSTHDESASLLRLIRDLFNSLDYDGQAEATDLVLEVMNGKDYANEARQWDIEHGINVPTSSPVGAVPPEFTPPPSALHSEEMSVGRNNALGEETRNSPSDKWWDFALWLVSACVVLNVLRSIISELTYYRMGRPCLPGDEDGDL